MIEIIKSVPVGQENALSARVIQAATDFMEEATVKRELDRLAESGTIKRRQQPTIGIAFRWLYWREGAAA